MRDLFCVVLAIILVSVASGQQTDVRYAISNASIDMTAASLGTAGLPSYSQLAVTDESAVTARADACPAGAFSLDDALTCTLCPAGKYSPQGTAPSPETCVSCEAGKYSLAAGASMAGTCVDCQNGTYSTTVSASLASVCLSCPANSTSYAGSRLLQACVCVPGHEGPNGAACSPCNASVWCLNGMANPCPSNSRSGPTSSSLAQCLCVPGYYGDTTMGGPDLTLCQVLTHDTRMFRIIRVFNGPQEGRPPRGERRSEVVEVKIRVEHGECRHGVHARSHGPDTALAEPDDQL